MSVLCNLAFSPEALGNLSRRSRVETDKGVHTLKLPPFGDRLPLGNWGEFSTRCEESTFRCSSPQQRVENSAATKKFHARASCFPSTGRRHGWSGAGRFGFRGASCASTGADGGFLAFVDRGAAGVQRHSCSPCKRLR